MVSPNIRLILPEQANEKRIILPEDSLLPQIANAELAGGAIFFTLWQALNITDSTASFEILFFDGNGDPMTLPLANPMNPTDFANPIPSIGFMASLPPGASAGQFTIPLSAPLQVGYAVVTATPEDSVAVIGIFNNQIPGNRLFQASIPMGPVTHDRFFTFYSGGVGGFVSSLALVASVAQTVTIIARQELTGAELCRSTRPMTQGQHIAVIIREELPCTDGVEGMLEVVGASGGLSGVAFVAADVGQGAFVTLPVWGQTPQK